MCKSEYLQNALVKSGGDWMNNFGGVFNTKVQSGGYRGFALTSDHIKL